MWGLDVRFFYGSEMGGGEETKRPFNSCNYLLEWQTSGRVGCVNFFLSAIYSLTVQQRQQGSLRQAVMYADNKKSGKQDLKR